MNIYNSVTKQIKHWFVWLYHRLRGFTEAFTLPFKRWKLECARKIPFKIPGSVYVRGPFFISRSAPYWRLRRIPSSSPLSSASPFNRPIAL